MKRMLLAATLALVAACGGIEPGDEDYIVLDDDTIEAAEQAMIWKPIPGDWVDCEHMGRICKCKGHVIDCRNPRPKPKLMLGDGLQSSAR